MLTLIPHQIGLVEEFVFRGFIFEKIKRVAGKDIIAVIISSVFFGVFHFFSGNLVQMVMTACIGAFFCFCRLKIKNCSTLSLIIGHGVYDALITVFASALLWGFRPLPHGLGFGLESLDSIIVLWYNIRKYGKI